MSFFKKMTNEFKELTTSDKKKEEGHDGSSSHADPAYSQHQVDSPQMQPHGQSAYPQPYVQPYGQPEYSQQYPGGAHQYSDEPPHPPPPPSSFIAQFDTVTQRTYYVETTGRSFWKVPPGIGAAASLDAHAAQQYPEHSKEYHGEEHSEKKKDNSSRNMLLAGGAGLAAGGVAGAMLADDSDDEHHTSAHAGAEGIPPVGYDAQTAPPAHDSDAESLHEAQQEYNEAVEAAADSDASSEELEELQEAREEVQDEQEEYYDD